MFKTEFLTYLQYLGLTHPIKKPLGTKIPDMPIALGWELRLTAIGLTSDGLNKVFAQLRCEVRTQLEGLDVIPNLT